MYYPSPEFAMPFEAKLNEHNRWCSYKVIPWDKFGAVLQNFFPSGSPHEGKPQRLSLSFTPVTTSFQNQKIERNGQYNRFQKLFEVIREGAKRGSSIAQYCQKNGILYNQYERWYKQFRNIVATPVEIVNENVKEQTLSETVSLKEPMSVNPVSRIQIELSNGLQITHREIDYRTLCRLVEKIEGLC